MGSNRLDSNTLGAICGMQDPSDTPSTAERRGCEDGKRQRSDAPRDGDSLSPDRRNTDRTALVGGGTWTSPRNTRTLDTNELLEGAFAKTTSGEGPDWLAEFEGYVRALYKPHSNGSERKEAITTLKYMTQMQPLEPADLMDRLLLQKDLDELPLRHPHWFGVLHQHKLKVPCSILLSCKEKGGHLRMFVSFEAPGGLTEGTIRRTGIKPSTTRIIPTTEFLLALVENLVDQQIGLKDVYDFTRSLVWVPNRIVVCALHRFCHWKKLKTNVQPSAQPPSIQQDRKSSKEVAPTVFKPVLQRPCPIETVQAADSQPCRIGLDPLGRVTPSAFKPVVQRPRPSKIVDAANFHPMWLGSEPWKGVALEKATSSEPDAGPARVMTRKSSPSGEQDSEPSTAVEDVASQSTGGDVKRSEDVLAEEPQTIDESVQLWELIHLIRRKNISVHTIKKLLINMKEEGVCAAESDCPRAIHQEQEKKRAKTNRCGKEGAVAATTMWKEVDVKTLLDPRNK